MSISWRQFALDKSAQQITKHHRWIPTIQITNWIQMTNSKRRIRRKTSIVSWTGQTRSKHVFFFSNAQGKHSNDWAFFNSCWNFLRKKYTKGLSWQQIKEQITMCSKNIFSVLDGFSRESVEDINLWVWFSLLCLWSWNSWMSKDVLFNNSEWSFWEKEALRYIVIL